jgi:hypothetical protein
VGTVPLFIPEASMLEFVSCYCVYCGEAVEVTLDTGGGSDQEFVEDCPVCCRPWNVWVSQDDSGVWTVELRTADD